MSFFLYNCEVKVMVTRSFSLISHLLEIHKALKVHLIYFLFLRCLGHMLAQSNVLCINQDSTSTRHDNLTQTSFKTPVCTQGSQGALRHQIFIFTDSSIGFFVDVTQSHLRVSKDFRRHAEKFPSSQAYTDFYNQRYWGESPSYSHLCSCIGLSLFYFLIFF